MTVGPVGVPRCASEDEDHDLEAQQSLPEILEAGIRDPLCRLATNKDGIGVQGKWRLIAAIVLCTLFMVRSTNHETSAAVEPRDNRPCYFQR